MFATTTRTRSRPSLAALIDRLDHMLDGLAEGLNEAIDTAVRDAVQQALRERVPPALAADLPMVLACLQRSMPYPDSTRDPVPTQEKRP